MKIAIVLGTLSTAALWSSCAPESAASEIRLLVPYAVRADKVDVATRLPPIAQPGYDPLTSVDRVVRFIYDETVVTVPLPARKPAVPAPLASVLDRVLDAPRDPSSGPDILRPGRASPPPVRRQLTASEADAIRSTIKPCWNVDPGAASPAVAIRVVMRQDQRVESAQVVDIARYNADPVFRQAADRARRAVLNQSCQPWPLPPDLWPDWQVVVMNFDPQDVP